MCTFHICFAFNFDRTLYKNISHAHAWLCALKLFLKYFAMKMATRPVRFIIFQISGSRESAYDYRYGRFLRHKNDNLLNNQPCNSARARKIVVSAGGGGGANKLAPF